LINSYDWTVINPANTIIHTTNTPTLTFTFPAPGTYTIKLTVNRSQECSDSTTTRVYFYPGFIPDFNYTGICITKPTAFTDNTSSVTGTVNSWNWDFGDAGSTLDISNIRNPVYTYPSLGTRDVTLTVTNTDGCRDTIVKSISIIDKPPINFAFRDTLICVNDQVQLQASGMGVFSWSPNINIVDANTANPIVFPITSTTYYVDLNSDGCLNRDSVKIRVVDHVSLQMMADTSICRGDTVRLRVVSDGLHFAWTPVSQLIDATAKQPLAIPAAITPYQVTATIGSCSANGHVTVTTVPRPTADAGSNMSICYNSSTQLNGSTDGESWQWTPASSLSNSTALNPIATPVGTTSYVFTTYDYTRGCPKPGSDTVVITVLPRIFPSAGNDTAVIVNQELQLQASGGSGYLWVPGANLSASNIANPIAIFREPSNGIPYKVKVFNEAGCADSALIIIKVFATQPTVFVPTAFTPNNDGKNDELLPIAVGMKHIEYFNVYNRWGQLVFTSAINGKGWDGRISGQLQGSNTYVWIVKAIDFRDMPYFLKGSSTLIR
jgi:gliding motility-associated-like protein